MYVPSSGNHLIYKGEDDYTALPGCLHVQCQYNEAWGSVCARSPEHRLLELVRGAGSFHTLTCPGNQLSSTEPLSAWKKTTLLYVVLLSNTYNVDLIMIRIS